MVWYSDENTKSLELRGDWVACVKYLHSEWLLHKNDIPIFLKLAVTTWYTLTLDGLELSLTEKEYVFLEKTLCETYRYFSDKLEQNENCQWIFGYMMAVRTDLFLSSNLDYDEIEQKGMTLIELSSNQGNLFAQLLFAIENCSKKDIKKSREKVKEHIPTNLDVSQEIDKYFIEMLMADFM